MNRDIPNTNEIQMYLHCGNCFDQRPEDVSPREWVSIECGWTEFGLQVWCKRCESNMLHVDFEGVKHPANTTRERKPHEPV